MPFEIRKTVFFVCPVCGEEYPLPDFPKEETTLQCARESCRGHEVFVDPCGYGKPLEISSAVSKGTDFVPGSGNVTSEPIGAGRPKQRVSITVVSALLINLALIITIVVILYLVPMIVYRCSEGERLQQSGGTRRTDPATESRFV